VPQDGHLMSKGDELKFERAGDCREDMMRLPAIALAAITALGVIWGSAGAAVAQDKIF